MKHIACGLPYCGSKSSVAGWLIDNLPPASTFVDLFCGGGAVTHAAMISGKYQHFIMNDRLPTADFFIDCVNGKYLLDDRRPFVGKEEFNKKKQTDMYVRLCYSFSNNGVDYLYSAASTPYKEVLHNTIFSTKSADELSEILQHKVYIPPSATDAELRWSMIREQVTDDVLKNTPMQDLRLPHYERQRRISALTALQPVINAYPVETFCMDYTEVKIPDDAIVYCDIPYHNTRQTAYGKFDHERFVAWLQEARKRYRIYVSEYTPPVPDCTCVAQRSRFVTCNRLEHTHATENIYLL